MKMSWVNFFLIILIISGCILISPKVSSNNDTIQTRSTPITVDQSGSGDYYTIQEAIDASNIGDSIIINNGDYNENIVITKDLSLTGQSVNWVKLSPTKVGSGIGIYIKDCSVQITKINIFNFNIGIKMENSHNTSVNGCILNDISSIGILAINDCNNIDIINNYVSNIRSKCMQLTGRNFLIKNNHVYNTIQYPRFDTIGMKLKLVNSVITDNSLKDLSFLGIEILPKCDQNIFKKNTINNCTWSLVQNNFQQYPIFATNHYISNVVTNGEGGIYIYYSIGCKIEKNIVRNIKNQGILCEGGDFFVENNSLYNCTTGIAMHPTLKSYVLNNQIHYGLMGIASGGHETIVINNTVKYGTIYGISSHASYSYFYNNYIEENDIGFICEARDNTISGNLFINNSKQAEDKGTRNKWNFPYPNGGNSWYDYQGKDILKGENQQIHGSDGFGDSKYTIEGGNYDYFPIFKDTISPVADAGPDVTIGSGTLYHFSLGNSHDDQLIHSAIWEWIYDGVVKKIELFNFDFNFSITGEYQVNLTVFDFAGNYDTDSVNITVKDLTFPVAIAQGNITINQGEMAYFDGSSSYDNEAIVSYMWEIVEDDESFATLYGPTTSFFFEDPFRGYCNLIVKDRSGNVAFDTFFINVKDLINPYADAGKDMIINNSQAVKFDGSGCTDNWGEWYNFQYNWSFLYGGGLVNLNGHSPEFIFDIPGYYEVAMIVFDHWGNSDTDFVLVTVVDTIPPIAKITGTLSVLENENLTLSGLASTENGIIVRYVWTFNDTEPKEIEGPFLNYSFIKKGLIEVTLTVFDQWNNSQYTKVTVEVEDSTSPFAIAGEDQTINVGDLVNLNGSRSTDDGTIVKWEWTFMYGRENRILLGEIVNFTFDIPGEYFITLNVYDQSGNIDEDQIIIIVMDPIDDDTENKERELLVYIVIIIGIIILLIMIGLAAFMLMRKKQPEEEQPIEEGKDDLEQMLENLPPEETYPSEQESTFSTEPEPIQEQVDVFGGFNLPEKQDEMATEPSFKENFETPQSSSQYEEIEIPPQSPIEEQPEPRL